MIFQGLGCFWGLVVGDALGGPFEFMSKEEIKNICGKTIEMKGGGWLCLKPGEYTDDSQMAIATAQAILEKNGWDPENVARHFVQWYLSGPKDIGRTTAQALSLIKMGTPWEEAGKQIYECFPYDSAGNGSLMRVAPVAIWGYKLKPEEIVKISHECSTITHADPRCLDACAALNLAIAFLLNEENKKSIVSKITPFIKNQEVIETLEKTRAKESELKTTGFVLNTLEIAFHALLHTSTFEEAVTWAISLGGDADTQGAVTGALCGSYYGIAEIPGKWIKKVKEFDPNLEKIISTFCKP